MYDRFLFLKALFDDADMSLDLLSMASVCASSFDLHFYDSADALALCSFLADSCLFLPSSDNVLSSAIARKFPFFENFLDVNDIFVYIDM